MNQSNAKDFLPLVIALSEGKTIQRNAYTKSEYGIWENTSELNCNLPPENYRIKPESLWFRVALLNYGEPEIHVISKNNLYTEESLEQDPSFVRWLTDRIEYEI